MASDALDYPIGQRPDDFREGGEQDFNKSAMAEVIRQAVSGSLRSRLFSKRRLTACPRLFTGLKTLALLGGVW